MAVGAHVAPGYPGDLVVRCEHGFECGGQLDQCAEQIADGSGRRGVVRADVGSDGGSKQRARRNLCVEGLGGGHRHLHIAAVGGVEHAVGPVGQVAAAPVDDGDHGRPPGASEIDRAIGIGGGAGLADSHDQRVGQVGMQAEAAELSRQGRRRLNAAQRARRL